MSFLRHFKDEDLSELYIKTQSVPRSKHYISVIQTSQLMLYRGIMAVCSEIHTKHINTLWGQNVEFVNVKLGGTYSDHWTLEGQDREFYCTPVAPDGTLW